ncbi:unspecific monooxygenase [Actinoalloteichus hoggarensis]|uniref:Biotin biosynthesis cytochrome P450 n=1 Tax=Actinoalloteichus hoggarensis TaxID=1470176 RepID=A0A221VWY6_9PSEU|nr:cytochrome P450 [Actinoalloteichus hoggarensis]ASO17761.1 Biotin biosynthesis cytochrome P450 [Actinoalloteichus hoggarensis]MBB5922888.1 unspecific monooxygenase [Actinoalloteichus hoggarensis]
MSVAQSAAAQPFDPTDSSFLADPYPTFAAMRAAGPVHRHDGMGLQLAVTHAAASAVLRHRSLGRVWTDAEPAAEFGAFNLLHQTSLLENEPPTHTRLRRLVSAAFGRGHVERLRPWVERLADQMVAGLADRIDATGSGDLLAEVAAPLPVEVIAELLGVPQSDRGLLAPWSNAIVKMYEFDLPEERRRAAEQAAREFVEYLRGLVALRRRAPGEDLVSDLVAVTDSDGARLSEDELIGTAVLLLMAGHEASVNVVGNGVSALLRHPTQWRRLLDDPSLLPTAADELIRFDSPLQLFERTAVEEVEIAGVVLAPGERVAALLGAAARDPLVFDDPDALDVGRDPNPHIGFGLGIHYCLGAPLARIEVTAILAALLRRLPTLSAAGTPRRRDEFVIRGLHDLPVSR